MAAPQNPEPSLQDRPGSIEDGGLLRRSDLVPAPSAEAVRSKARALVAGKATGEAIRVWEQHLARSPQDAEAANDLGDAMIAAGRPEEAIPWLKRALTVRPGMVAARHNLGLAQFHLRRFDEAVVRFESVLELHPDSASACFYLGRSLNALQRHDGAVVWLRKAHVLRPGDVEIVMELGGVLRAIGQNDGAIEMFRSALSLEPENGPALSSLGSALLEQRAFDDAATVFSRLAERAPDETNNWLNLASAYLSDRRYAEAVASFRRAIATQPGSVIAYCNIALALFSLGRLDEGIAACKTALVIEPGSAVANFNMACILLALGRFEEAWPCYEFRFALGGKTWVRDEAHAAPWQGEAPDGKSFVVLGEQGNGDHIQFCRYVAMLAGRGARVTYLAPARLHGLLSSLGGSIRMLEDIPAGSRFDYQTPLMSIPRWIGRSDPRASDEPYLGTEPARVARWRDAIGPDGFRIGVVWQGNVYPAGDFRRSYRLEALRPIALMPGVRLISLQMGPATEQLGTLPSDMAVERLPDDFDSGDQAFLDTAAVIANLDLVISCDTSVAHLAGALGHRVWIVLPADPEWRWQRHREETDWYPTARLFRQKTPNDWDGVFHEVARALAGVLDGWQADRGAGPEWSRVAPNVSTSWGNVLDRMARLEQEAKRSGDSGSASPDAEELAALQSLIEGRRPMPLAWEDALERLRRSHADLIAVREDLVALERADQFSEAFVTGSRRRLHLESEQATLIQAVNGG